MRKKIFFLKTASTRCRKNEDLHFLQWFIEISFTIIHNIYCTLYIWFLQSFFSRNVTNLTVTINLLEPTNIRCFKLPWPDHIYIFELKKLGIIKQSTPCLSWSQKLIRKSHDLQKGGVVNNNKNLQTSPLIRCFAVCTFFLCYKHLCKTIVIRLDIQINS